VFKQNRRSQEKVLSDKVDLIQRKIETIQEEKMKFERFYESYCNKITMAVCILNYSIHREKMTDFEIFSLQSIQL